MDSTNTQAATAATPPGQEQNAPAARLAAQPDIGSQAYNLPVIAATWVWFA